MRQFGGAWTANADKNEKGEDTDISENQATDDVVGPQRSAENSQAVFVKLCERMAVSTCPYVSAMDRTVRALGAAYTPCYYSIDGNLKLSDQSLSADSKFFGVTDVDYFGEAQSNFFTSTNAYIDPPTDGDLTKDPADETDVPPSQNTGHLDWIVQKKSGSVSQWFNFDQSDGNNTALATGNSTFPAIWLNKPHSSEFPITTNSAYNSNSAVVLTSDGSINAQSGKMLKVRGSSGIASFLSIVFRFSAVKSYEEKSIFLDFYFPAASKNALESEALKVRLGNNITQTGSGGNDAYVYLVGSDQINADAWTTLEFVHGQHDEVEGSPNGSAIDMVKIDTHYQNDLDSLSNDGVYYLDIIYNKTRIRKKLVKLD